MPVSEYGKAYSTTVFNCLKWMNTVGEDSLSCPNGMSGLVGDNSSTKWPSVNYRAFRTATIELWNNWNEQWISGAISAQSSPATTKTTKSKYFNSG